MKNIDTAFCISSYEGISFFSIISFTQDMKTNKPKLKTQRKTRLNIQLSQTLIMNAANDIKILDMHLQFSRGCI